MAAARLFDARFITRSFVACIVPRFFGACFTARFRTGRFLALSSLLGEASIYFVLLKTGAASCKTLAAAGSSGESESLLYCLTVACLLNVTVFRGVFRRCADAAAC